MGQKVHPIGFRLGITKNWDSIWYAEKDYTKLLHEDIKIRKLIKERLWHAGIPRILIERTADKVRITIYAARPGIIIGKRGAEVERLKNDVQNLSPKRKIYIDIVEVKRPELEAQLIAENIALQLERRVSYRRAMKRAIAAALKYGALGIKVECSGRLAGAEMARTEWYREGKLPLQTLRADIDYGFAEAFTKYGVIGVKAWIYKGEVEIRKSKRKEEVKEIVEEVK